jgi:hypothetical protein
MPGMSGVVEFCSADTAGGDGVVLAGAGGIGMPSICPCSGDGAGGAARFVFGFARWTVARGVA